MSGRRVKQPKTPDRDLFARIADILEQPTNIRRSILPSDLIEIVDSVDSTKISRYSPSGG
jgi:hypothetical protein